jgi:hypothetical protein
MILHTIFSDNQAGKKHLHDLIRQKKIILGGNLKLKIYGSLKCSSGKRMLRENRVFFRSEEEAIANGFRPCGHCMRVQYKSWKSQLK